jgi:hypothetical protein
MHLPEPLLDCGCLGPRGGGERVLMDLGLREMPEREPHPIAEPPLDALDLAISRACVGALVVPVLDDQASGHATADVIDRVVDRLETARASFDLGAVSHGDAERACPAKID